MFGDRELVLAAVARAQAKTEEKVVTLVEERSTFYLAEARHQNCCDGNEWLVDACLCDWKVGMLGHLWRFSCEQYFDDNPRERYCARVVHPKLRKIKHTKFKYRPGGMDKWEGNRDPWAGGVCVE